MIEVATNIYMGNQTDFENLRYTSGWSFLHCCKDPYHKELVGYSGNLSSTNPDYAYKIIGHRMALNLVDMDFYSANYLQFNKDMFENAFNFLDNQLRAGNKVLIHCNQGESRAPSLTMLYLARIGVLPRDNFLNTFIKFKMKYPIMNPKKNIITTVENLWDVFVK